MARAELRGGWLQSVLPGLKAWGGSKAERLFNRMAPMARQKYVVKEERTAVIKNSWISRAGTEP